MNPSVSVIMPAFNADQFITEAILSILNQSFDKEIEIIVVDDNSTDNTKEIVKSLGREHNEIVLLDNKRSKGPSGARNTGLLEARCDFIAFLDADDLWTNNHLLEGTNFLSRNTDVDAVFYNFEVINFDTKEVTGDWFSMRNFTNTVASKAFDDNYSLIVDDLFIALLNEMFIHLQCLIARREAILGTLFNENIKISEDRDFLINMYLNSNARFAFKNIITGVYHRHGNSLTSDGSLAKSLSEAIDHISLFSDYLSLDWLDNARRQLLHKLLLRSHISASYIYRHKRMHVESFTHLHKSLKHGFTKRQPLEFVKILASAAISIVKKDPGTTN